MCVSLLQDLRRHRQQLLLKGQILGKRHQQLRRGHSVSTAALWVVVSLTIKWSVVRTGNKLRERKNKSLIIVWRCLHWRVFFLLRPRCVGWVGLEFFLCSCLDSSVAACLSRILFSVSLTGSGGAAKGRSVPDFVAFRVSHHSVIYRRRVNNS